MIQHHLPSQHLKLVQLIDVIRNHRKDDERAALLQKHIQRLDTATNFNIIDVCIKFLGMCFSKTLFQKGQLAHRLRRELKQDQLDIDGEKFITNILGLKSKLLDCGIAFGELDISLMIME